MPQLDVASFLTQYISVLLALLLLFFVMVLGLLPVLQQQLVLRIWAEERFKGKRSVHSVKAGGSALILRGLLS